jgi:hypothetical protein
MRRLGRPWKTASAAALLLLAGTTIAVGQGGGSAQIHLEIKGGSHPGIYDLANPEPCVSDGAGGWTITFDDPAQVPPSIQLTLGAGYDLLMVTFGDNSGYTAAKLTVHLQGSQDEPTISVSARATDVASLGAGKPTATVKMRVVCSAESLAQPTEAPPPTPAVEGSPPPGSTVFHVSVDFGPWAGTYDVWTMDSVCDQGDGIWSATYNDASVIPAMVSLVAADDGSGTLAGTLSVAFGSFPDLTFYSTSADAAIALDGSTAATVSDTQATMTSPASADAEGSLEANITCAPGA